MSINNVRAVGDDRPWKDEVERDLKKIWDAIKYGKLSITLSSSSSVSGAGGGADLSGISASLPATYDDVNYIVGVDQDAFEHISNLDYAQFDTTYATGSNAVGQMAWSVEHETLEFKANSAVTLQLGQEHVIRVKNASGSTAIPQGVFVMFAGATGDTVAVSPATNDGTVPASYFVGLTTQEIAADGFGFVTTQGFVNGLDTSALSLGDLLYISATGGLWTTTMPSAPAVKTPLAAVTRVHAETGRVLVRMSFDPMLGSIPDVSVGGAAGGDLLMYNSGTDLWENEPQSALVIAESQVTNLVSDLAAKAPTASPTFTGTVTTPLTTAGYVTTTSGGILGSVATIPNAGLTNSSVTVNGSSVSLGGSVTVTAEPTGAAGGKLSGTYPNPGLNASIDDLNDVTITTPSSGQALTYNGSAWVNTTPASGGTVTSVAAGTGLSASPSPITTTGTISLADTAVTAASYGSATQVGAFTVDAQGRLTAASNTSIQIAESQVTNLVTDLAGKAGLTTANGFTGVNTFTKQGTANSPSIRTESASWATSPKVGLVTNSGSNTGSSTNNIALESRADSTAARYHFSFSNANGVVGSINTSGTATAYTTSSDYRLKENVTPMVGAAERVMQLKPSRFTFINDSAKFVDGFIAHELGEVIPEAVFGEKDAINEDGTPNYQGIDQSKVVPLLTAALQDALKKIAELTDRIEALEN
jgi:hypothetical protein